jgi:cobalt-zinc-cadmium efflux system outer membrane protein
MNPLIVLLIATAQLVFSSGATYANQLSPAENLPRLIETALVNNPELAASDAHRKMLENKARQAGSLEDPMLTLKLQNGVISDPFSFRRDSMTQKVIGISQQFPWYGKRKLRSDVAGLNTEVSHWSRLERIQEIVRMVKETYYQTYFTDRSLEIVVKNLRVLDDFITLAQSRYAVGKGAQQDIYRAQLEKSKLIDLRISLEQQRRGLDIRMNSLLYRPMDAKVGMIPDFDPSEISLTPAQLEELAEKNRPLMKAQQAQISKSEASNALAKKEFYPDVAVSFEYMQREPAMGGDGADMYSLGLTFNLPIQRDRRHAMLAETTSERVMATAELSVARNTIRSGIADLLSQMERRRKLATLYKRGIIPQAEQVLESVTIGYKVGKVDLLTLLDSRMNLFNYERDYYDSITDYQIRLTQLEEMVGTDLATGTAMTGNTHQHTGEQSEIQ